MRSTIIAIAVAFVAAACTTTEEPSARAICLDAVGELHASIEEYDELLETGVAEMRDDDAAEKLGTISNSYRSLFEALEARAATVPSEVESAHGLLSSGVGMQVTAWMSISDGIQFQDPDLIDDGAELIILSREVVAQSQQAIPDCSAAGD